MDKRDLIISVALKNSEELQNKGLGFHYKYCQNVRLSSINLAAKLNQST